jgi:hypothetical protein
MNDKSWRIRRTDGGRVEFSVTDGRETFVLTMTADWAADLFARCLAVAQGQTLAAGADE